MSIILSVLLVLVGCVVSFIALSILFYLRTKTKVKVRIKKDRTAIKEYFKEVTEANALAIIDETPRMVELGTGNSKRVFVIRPLKYRQVTRLCILFAHTLEKLQKTNIDLSDPESVVGQVVEHCEDDFFKSLSYILYYSQWPNEVNDIVVGEGAREILNYLKSNITLDQMSMLLEVVAMQNDIQRALKSFGRLNTSKKKVLVT